MFSDWYFALFFWGGGFELYYVCDCSRAVTNVHPKVYVPMNQEEAMLYIYHLSEDHEGRQCSSYSQKKCVHWTYDLGLTEASPLVTMDHLAYYAFLCKKSTLSKIRHLGSWQKNATFGDLYSESNHPNLVLTGIESSILIFIFYLYMTPALHLLQDLSIRASKKYWVAFSWVSGSIMMIRQYSLLNCNKSIK